MGPFSLLGGKIRKLLAINSNIQWYLLGRFAVISALFILTLLYQLVELSWNVFSPVLFPLYIVMFVTYLFSAGCAFISPRVKEPKKFVASLIAYDTIFITALIYLSGTKESYFPFLYLLAITFASLIFARRGALRTALLSSVCYTTLMIIDPLAHDSGLFINLIINNAAFFIVGLLAGYVAEELKITGLKLFETKKEMKVIEDFNQAILDNIAAGLLSTTASGKITYLNKAGEKLLGKTFGQLKYYLIEDVLPEFSEILSLYKNNGGAADMPLELRYKRERWEEEIYLDFAISTLTIEGSENGWIFIFQDRTELQSTQEQLELADKQASIGKMVAGIAHEIRNPLASMSGSVEILKQTVQMEAEDQKLMNIIGKEIDRLNGLIEELLDYTRPAVKKDEGYSLSELINETVEELKLHRKYSESIKIELNVPVGKLGLEGDRWKIKQVFLNLLINACQAMASGGVISVSITDAKDHIAIDVSDTGCGISERDINKIFDPFFTTKDNGTGLGLAMVYKIIENHGGVISVSSRPGKGTKFSILLPKPHVLLRKASLLKERAS